MIRHATTRRPGTSLMEVLVGFGILGIAVTSVITLFPFSALTIGQALRDDRTTTCAVMADGEFRDVHRRFVVDPGDDKTTEYYHRVMDNPALPGAAGRATRPAGPADSTEPSYAVFVDPMGIAAGRGPVGDGGQTLIPRTSLQLVGGNDQMALRYCTLLDSLSFDEDGKVQQSYDMRELRYNWAWMLQRPVNRDRYNVRLQVVVFSNRAHKYKPPLSEAVYQATFTPGETAIRGVPGTAEIRKGSWVLDATVSSDANGLLRQGEWYRVVSVTDGANGTYSLEVHKPVARVGFTVNPANTGAGAYTGTLVSMPGVAEVFDRDPLTGSTTNVGQ